MNPRARLGETVGAGSPDKTDIAMVHDTEILKRLEDMAGNTYGTDAGMLLTVLESSHGAEGYIFGALGEMYFKAYAERAGFEVLRIKEKPEGGNKGKSDEARGDFYIRPRGSREDKWFVVECKNVKSNAEAHNGCLTKKQVIRCLCNFSVRRSAHIESVYKTGYRNYSKAKETFENDPKHAGKVFPAFRWPKSDPGAGIPDLSSLWGSGREIEEWVEQFPEELFTKESYWRKKAPVRWVQTHMPSGRTDALGIKKTGPLVTEFNILCVDLFLRTGRHEFVFANSRDLNHQAAAPNHLQQNYTIDVLVEKDGFQLHALRKPWYEDLTVCIEETHPSPRKLDVTQLDFRT